MSTVCCITALETDVMEMYSKYLALNATKPVGMTDEIRQRVEGDLKWAILLTDYL